MRRTTTRPAPRGGFTLVELLVVVAIMALLAALVAAGIGQVRNAQMSKTTDQTMTKLQLALNTQYKDVLKRCQQDARSRSIPTAFVGFCGDDMERAESLWAYVNLKREFPETFAEATTQIAIPGAPMPRKTFAAVTTGGAANDQAAALLYLALTEKSAGGSALPDDATQGGGTGQDGTYRVFKDAWGTSISLTRFFSKDEAQAAAYTNAKAGPMMLDLLDPYPIPGSNPRRGKLTDATWANRATALAAIRQNAGRSAGVDFDGRNKLLTVVSGGADKDIDDDADDSYGFRLTKQGNKGD